MPVSKSAALTIHIPTTIAQPGALNPAYTSESSICGIRIPIATELPIATTLIGNLFHMNSTIVIAAIIIAIILELIVFSPFPHIVFLVT